MQWIFHLPTRASRRMYPVPPQTAQRTRSWSLTAPATLANEKAVAALPCIHHIVDANRLTWPGVGHHPDCQFASFIHASQQREPTWDLIIATRRKCRNWLSLNPPEKQKRHGSAYHQEAPLLSQGASAALWCLVVAALSTYPSLLVCAERLPAPKLQVCHLFAVLPRNPRFTRMLRLHGGSSSGEDKEEEKDGLKISRRDAYHQDAHLFWEG